MEIVRYVAAGDPSPRVGVRDGDAVAPLTWATSLAEVLRVPLADLPDRLSQVGAGTQVSDVQLLPPVDGRTEVWCSGVTYERSRGARMEESTEASVYDKVYDAERPELFLKSPAWRVVTDGEPIGIRADSTIDVPEPELALVCNAGGEVVGYTVCNDVSSRSIEGENPLYIPQAKVFAGGCALATGIRPAWEVADSGDLRIEVRVLRAGETVFSGDTSTAQLHRSLEGLVEALFFPNHFPDGAVLATGTGVVPELDFSLEAGDRVEIEIVGVGTLANPVVRGRDELAWLVDAADDPTKRRSIR